MKKKLINTFNEYKFYILINIIILYALYIFMIGQNLSNSNDGIWNVFMHKAAGREVSLGRFLLPIFDRMRFGIVHTGMNAVMFFPTLVLSYVIIWKTLDIKSLYAKYIGGIIFSASPVVCDTLSYQYTSVSYGLGMLFACLSAYLISKADQNNPYISKRNIYPILGAGFLMACTMSCYQAYLGVTALVVSCFILKKIRTGKRNGLSVHLIAFISSSVVGMLFYLLFYHINKFVWHIEASDYMGADSISFSSIIKNFPDSILSAYSEFNKYTFQYNKFGFRSFFIILVIISFVSLIYYFKNNFSLISIVLYFSVILLIPAACNIILLIAPQAELTVLMSGALFLAPALLAGCTADALSLSAEKMPLKYIFVLSVSAFIVSNISIISNDQLAMLQGEKSAASIESMIASSMINKGFLPDSTEIAIIGRPSDNPLFYKSYSWENANDYAQVGNFWSGSFSSPASWRGVALKCLGLNFKYCSSEEYDMIYDSEEFKSMPVFPAEGGMLLINNILVIKISE